MKIIEIWGLLQELVGMVYTIVQVIDKGATFASRYSPTYFQNLPINQDKLALTSFCSS